VGSNPTPSALVEESYADSVTLCVTCVEISLPLYCLFENGIRATGRGNWSQPGRAGLERGIGYGVSLGFGVGVALLFSHNSKTFSKAFGSITIAFSKAFDTNPCGNVGS
jgi:hypothetical protein